jgi:hypothetical protein
MKKLLEIGMNCNPTLTEFGPTGRKLERQGNRQAEAGAAGELAEKQEARR